MSHIVVYQTDDGSSGFEQCKSLDDAIVVAERMRNVDGVEAPRIFRMEEVQIDFRPYYRVEVADADSGGSEPGGSSGEQKADATDGDTTLDDLPAPPSPEAVAEAEAETGAQMSSDAPTWDSESADQPATDDAGDAAVAEAPIPDVAGADDAGSSPEHGDEGGDEDGAGDDGADDAMISVRRGLFGR